MLLQCAAVLFGVYALARTLLDDAPAARWLAFGVVAVLVSPLTPTAIHAMTLWKDTWMAAFFLWIVVAALRARSSTARGGRRRGLAWLALLILLAAAASILRHNGPALLPALSLAVYIAARPLVAPAPGAIVLAALPWLAPLAGEAFTRARVERRFPAYGAVMAVELAGLCRESETLCARLPHTRRHLDLDLVRERFRPGDLGALAFDGPQPHALDLRILDRPEALSAEYRDALREAPWRIARLKWLGWLELLGVWRTSMVYWPRGIIPNPFGLSQNLRFAAVRAAWERAVDWIVAGPGWRWIAGVHLVWLAVNAFLIAANRGRVIAILLLVPLSYYLSYLPATPVPDYRFLFAPTLLVQVIAVALALRRVTRRVEATGARSSPAPAL
jgi:hypothetical protein